MIKRIQIYKKVEASVLHCLSTTFCSYSYYDRTAIALPPCTYTIINSKAVLICRSADYIRYPERVSKRRDSYRLSALQMVTPRLETLPVSSKRLRSSQGSSFQSSQGTVSLSSQGTLSQSGSRRGSSRDDESVVEMLLNNHTDSIKVCISISICVSIFYFFVLELSV